MSAEETWINVELRDVAIPPNLTARLREIGTLSDADLDAALRSIQPTLALRDQLLAVGTRSDADLDAELRLVPVPLGLLERCREIPLTSPSRIALAFDQVRTLAMRPLSQWVVAASLLLTLFGVSWNYFRAEPNSTVAIPTVTVPAVPSVAADPTILINPRDLDPLPSTNLPTLNPPAIPQKSTLVLQPDLAPDRPVPLPGVNPGKPIGNGLANNNTGPNSAANANNTIDPSGVFGTNPGRSSLPDLMSVQEPVSRGVRPPNVREYDLIFQLRHGVHPFVSPAAHGDLKQVQVPLVSAGSMVGSDSFEQVRRQLSTGRSLLAGQPRVEDFLAAMDYEFALPGKPTLALQTAAGISPWSQQGLGLIQVGVQAGAIPRGKIGPQRVTLILDASANLTRDNRWSILIQGLEQWAMTLATTDRVTVVLAGERAEVLAVDQSATELLPLFNKLRTHQPTGVCAIAQALELAIPADLKTSRKVLLCTAGLLPLTAGQFAELNQQLPSRLTKSKSKLHLLDLRPDDNPESALQLIASWSGMPVMNVPNSQQVLWQLSEIVDETSQVVAHDVSLRVNFVPEAVALYRLLGHEATAVSSLIPLEWQTDLRHTETATGLFEVALRPNGPDIIATVELTWRDSSGKQHRKQQPISRLQFAASQYEAPWSLQLASLAAETAEILRGSYFAPVSSHDLDSLVEVSKRLPQRLQSKPSLLQLQQLWQLARQPKAKTASP